MDLSFILPHGMELGGVTTWSIRLAEILAKKRHHVSIIEHVVPENQLNVDLSPSLRLLRCKGKNPDFVRNKRDVGKYIRVYKKAASGIVIPNFSSGAYGTFATLSLDPKRDFRIIGFGHTDELYYYNLLSYYAPIISIFIAVSNEVKEELVSLLPNRSNDICVLPYGVEVQPQLHREYSRETEPIRLVYAGRLVEYQKRVSRLILLSQYLDSMKVNFRLDIVGDGPEKNWMMAKVAEIEGISGRTRFLGRVPFDRMEKIYREADICVLVSEYEGTSISMLEAMAQGCVPVVTNVSGTDLVIEPGRNGFTVRQGDIEGLAVIIRHLEKNRPLIGEVGEKAHETIKFRFSVENYIENFETILRKVSRLPQRSWPADLPILPPRPEIPFRALVKSKLPAPIRRLITIGKRMMMKPFKSEDKFLQGPRSWL